MSLPMTRDEAWTLFCEWTASESLRRHVLAVEACMRAYAERFREEAGPCFGGGPAWESLRRHVLAVEACMRAYAERFGEDPERWGMVGMLHDLDYERYPDLHTGHPRYALAELERLSFPEDMIRAVA